MKKLTIICLFLSVLMFFGCAFPKSQPIPGSLSVRDIRTLLEADKKDYQRNLSRDEATTETPQYYAITRSGAFESVKILAEDGITELDGTLSDWVPIYNYDNPATKWNYVTVKVPDPFSEYHDNLEYPSLIKEDGSLVQLGGWPFRFKPMYMFILNNKLIATGVDRNAYVMLDLNNPAIPAIKTPSDTFTGTPIPMGNYLVDFEYFTSSPQVSIYSLESNTVTSCPNPFYEQDNYSGFITNKNGEFYEINYDSNQKAFVVYKITGYDYVNNIILIQQEASFAVSQKFTGAYLNENPGFENPTIPGTYELALYPQNTLVFRDLTFTETLEYYRLIWDDSFNFSLAPVAYGTSEYLSRIDVPLIVYAYPTGATYANPKYTCSYDGIYVYYTSTTNTFNYIDIKTNISMSKTLSKLPLCYWIIDDYLYYTVASDEKSLEDLKIIASQVNLDLTCWDSLPVDIYRLNLSTLTEELVGERYSGIRVF